MISLLPQNAETGEVATAPGLLVELPSRSRVFFGNLRDLIFPRRLPALELTSGPADFWPDVFVNRRIPWLSFLESIGYHVIAIAIGVGVAHFLALHPPPLARPNFDHSQVVYYAPSEYLPPLDTRAEPSEQPAKADPEYAPQTIISVPAEADNRSQTIVAPPNVRLKQDVALPNIVSWSDKAQKPQLQIPPVPLTPAAEISRMTPRMESAVVSPPPEAAGLARRDQVRLQTSVVAPPPDLQARSSKTFSAPEPAVVAPPPGLQDASTRRVSAINIGPSQVIAPAPQLKVAEQRAIAGGRPGGLAGSPQVVPPPPSTGTAGSGGQSFGSPGRVIALSLHPAVEAPPTPPAGNRRGTFAAGPGGHTGASGSPGTATGSTAGTGAANGNGRGTGTGSKRGSNDVPSGLYVGNPPASAKTSSVAGDPSGKPPNSPTTIASANVSTPRVTNTPSRPAQPDSGTKLSDAERAVFGNRKLYSLTLNMPNLNSAGGSWVIRFAELKQDPRAPVAEVSQPTATRKVDPGYPLQLMRENVAGTVILYAVIRADGTVGDVRLLNGVDDRLDRLAASALAQWKFDPATKNGSPIDVEATFKIPFRPSKTTF